MSRPHSHLSTEPSRLFTLGSRSSLSTVSSSSLNSPMKFGSSQFFDSNNRNGSQGELSDMSDSGMSNETLRKLQSFSQNYEVLAKSTISLFNGEEDILNSDLNDDPAPELPSKKKVKHKAENYLQIVGDYYNDRPSSLYDNLPIGTLPNINNVDELVVRGAMYFRVQELVDSKLFIDLRSLSNKEQNLPRCHFWVIPYVT